MFPTMKELFLAFAIWIGLFILANLVGSLLTAIVFNSLILIFFGCEIRRINKLMRSIELQSVDEPDPWPDVTLPADDPGQDQEEQIRQALGTLGRNQLRDVLRVIVTSRLPSATEAYNQFLVLAENDAPIDQQEVNTPASIHQRYMEAVAFLDNVHLPSLIRFLYGSRGQQGLTQEELAEIPRVTIDQKMMEQELNCAICLTDFQLDDEASRLVCAHQFHPDCIGPWLQSNRSCPLCRRVL